MWQVIYLTCSLLYGPQFPCKLGPNNLNSIPCRTSSYSGLHLHHNEAIPKRQNNETKQIVLTQLLILISELPKTVTSHQSVGVGCVRQHN